MNTCVVAYKFGTEKEIGEHLGTYHYFIEKMRTLVRMGHKVTVIAPWLGFFKRGSVDIDGVKVIRYYPPLHPFRWWYIKATQKQVLRLDKEINLDVIYVWQARETGYAVAQIAHRLRAPFFFRQITAWEWHFQRGMPDQKAQMKFRDAIYDKAKKIVFVSRAASEEGLRAGLSPDKIEVIGIGVDSDVFAPDEKKQPGHNLLFVGRINFAEKGIGVLLAAMAEIVKSFPDAKLTVVGGGGEIEKVKSEIERLKIDKHVILAGKKPFMELPRLINSADVFVVPSLWLEHFGQVTIDALSCGVPVVGTNMGGTPEIITPSLSPPVSLREIGGDEVGVLIPPNNPQALAEAVQFLIANPETARKLGKAGRQRVLENYTYEVLANKFLEVAKNVQR